MDESLVFGPLFTLFQSGGGIIAKYVVENMQGGDMAKISFGIDKKHCWMLHKGLARICPFLSLSSLKACTIFGIRTKKDLYDSLRCPACIKKFGR